VSNFALQTTTIYIKIEAIIYLLIFLGSLQFFKRSLHPNNFHSEFHNHSC